MKLHRLPTQHDKNSFSDYLSAKKEEEDDSSFQKRKVYSGIVYTAYLLTVIIFAIILFTYRSPDIRFNSESIGRLTGTWRISHGSVNETATLPYQTEIPAGETVTYSITLPKCKTSSGTLCNSIMFRAFHEYVKVYVDGELLYDFGYDQNMAFSDAPNNGWLIVRLPENFTGKVLSIEKNGYYDNFAGSLHDVYIGTKNALVFFVLHNCMPLLFINMCIILLSLYILIASFFFTRRYTVYQLRYLSIFSMITSIWLILESGGYQLFAGSPVVIGNLVFLFFSLIPLALVRFLLTYECFQDSRYMKCLFYCSFGGVLLVHLLQVSGIADYLQSIFITHIMIVSAILGILGKYIKMRLKKEKMVNAYLFISCFVFALFAFADLVRFYLINPPRPTLFSQIGFFLYFVILCCFAIHKIVKDNEGSLNKLFFQQMAYTDLLTGLPNRNAFEREMEYYMKEKALKPSVMMIDLNGLKNINDSYGHSQGDNAIIHVAHALRECFAAKGHVFRIGGDEFCAIFQTEKKDTLKKEMADFDKQILDKKNELAIPLSVAVGWAKTDEGNDIVQAFNIADACMYENKKRLKEIQRKKTDEKE